MKPMQRLADIFTIMCLVLLQHGTMNSQEIPSAQPSALELEQAFAVLDAVLPRRSDTNERLMKSVWHYHSYSNRLNIPLFKHDDFAQEFINRLVEDHVKVMTSKQEKSLTEDGKYFRVLDGHSYLPEFYDIQWIHQKDANSAEALIQCGGAGGMSRHKILLEHSSGQWVLAKEESVETFD